MYDVMIIDDDKSIIDRLKKIIDWKDNGVRLVYEAQDSDTARELFLLHRPNIIITDIQIPIISGLDLAQELIEISPNVRFIIITGYTDFEYVQTSVKLGAVDLISKPIMPEGINNSLQKAVQYFDKLKFDHISSQNINLLLEKNLALFQHNFLSYILHNKTEYSIKHITEKLESLKIDISAPSYVVVLIRPDLSNLAPKETDSVLVAIQNTLNHEFLDSSCKVVSFYDNDYCLNCIISWEEKDFTKETEQALINVHNTMEFYWNVSLSSGFSSPTTKLTELYKIRYEAYIALTHQSILDIGPVVYYKNIIRLDYPILSDRSKLINQLINYVNNNKLSEMKQLLSDEVNTMYKADKAFLALTRKLIIEFVTAMINMSISLEINMNNIPSQSDIYCDILMINNIEIMLQKVFDLAEKISTKLMDKRNNKKNHLIMMAKEYIQSNLGKSDLSLDSVSDVIGLSSVYFCKLFNKEEGISFNNYLNQERINKAKELLKDTNLKVFEVAYQTGFNNQRYFYFVFKKIVGFTPLEYRNSKS